MTVLSLELVTLTYMLRNRIKRKTYANVAGEQLGGLRLAEGEIVFDL